MFEPLQDVPVPVLVEIMTTTKTMKSRIQTIFVGLLVLGTLAGFSMGFLRDFKKPSSVGGRKVVGKKTTLKRAAANRQVSTVVNEPSSPRSYDEILQMAGEFEQSNPMTVVPQHKGESESGSPVVTPPPLSIPSPSAPSPEMLRESTFAPTASIPYGATTMDSRGPESRNGFQPMLTVIPERQPRSAEEVRMFMENLTTPDAQFEVVLGQARLLTLRRDLATAGKPSPVLAIGDPSIIALEVMPNPRLLRVTGLRPGITDVVITSSEGETYTFQAHVVFNLRQVQHWLRQLFPDAHLKLSQFHEHVVVEGEARHMSQSEEILDVVRAYLKSAQANRGTAVRGEAPPPPPPPQRTPQAQGQNRDNRGQAGDAAQRPQPGYEDDEPNQPAPTVAGSDGGSSRSGGSNAEIGEPQIINRIRVPGPQQILLKVQVAELNRTSLRQVGSDLLFSHGGNTFGTQLGGASNLLGSSGTGGSVSVADGASLAGLIGAGPTAGATAFGIMEGIDTQIFMSVLRNNSILKILAEPNLVAMNGHKATFLAGGEFPIPVTQPGGGNAVTVQFREFGVRLAFEPFDLGDKRIRLAVNSEVSSVDFSLATTLVSGGQPVPGLSTRNVQTTVELAEGKTLMMAGLLQVNMDGSTKRIPGLGELPTIGTLFRNNTGRRQEKELVVLVTPHLVEGVNENQRPLLPGEDVGEANDLEFYLRGKIENRCGQDFRSTTNIPPVKTFRRSQCLEKNYMKGSHGYSQ